MWGPSSPRHDGLSRRRQAVKLAVHTSTGASSPPAPARPFFGRLPTVERYSSAVPRLASPDLLRVPTFGCPIAFRYDSCAGLYCCVTLSGDTHLSDRAASFSDAVPFFEVHYCSNPHRSSKSTLLGPNREI